MFANIIDTSTRKIPYCARFLNADFQISIVKFWINSFKTNLDIFPEHIQFLDQGFSG